MMLTKYQVIGASDVTPQEFEVDIPQKPGLAELEKLVLPHLNGGDMEHVSVLLPDGTPGDMFVDDIGKLKKLPVSPLASSHYQRYWLKRHPDARPENLNQVYGPAVLFLRRVWH